MFRYWWPGCAGSPGSFLGSRMISFFFFGSGSLLLFSFSSVGGGVLQDSPHVVAMRGSSLKCVGEIDSSPPISICSLAPCMSMTLVSACETMSCRYAFGCLDNMGM